MDSSFFVWSTNISKDLDAVESCFIVEQLRQRFLLFALNDGLVFGGGVGKKETSMDLRGSSS